jgi:hypothetical protein
MIYYINLDRSTDRRACIEADVATLGRTAQRIPAITPATLHRVVPVRLADTAPRDRWIAQSVIASHLVAYEALVASSDPWALILEDDVDLRAAATWGFDLDTLAAAFPAGAGMVQLVPIWSRLYPTPDLALHPHRFRVEWCTAATWVRRDYAEQVLVHYRVEDGRYDLAKYAGALTADTVLFDGACYGGRVYATPLLYCRGADDDIDWTTLTTLSRNEGQQRMHQQSREAVRAQLEAHAPVTLAQLGLA